MKSKEKLIVDLPDFSQIQISGVESALDSIFTVNHREIERLLRQSHYTWGNFVLPYEEINDRLQKYWSTIMHLSSVQDSDELRKVYSKSAVKVSEYYTDLIQNNKLYKAFLAIKKNKLTKTQAQFINNTIRDFKLSGINLNKQDKKKYKSLCKNLVKKENQFCENVLDATAAYKLNVKTKKELKGMPEQVISHAKGVARSLGQKGYTLDLHFPTFLAVMRYADNRKLRQKIYKAYVTKASEVGPNKNKFDNGNIIKEILSIRHKLAKLLNFDNYAQLSLARKMASSPKKVLQFLYELNERSKTKSEEEIGSLIKYGKKIGITRAMPWDLEYLREMYKKEHFSVSQEDLQMYFPLDAVLRGLFSFIKKLFGLKINKITASTWDESVQVYEVRDALNKLKGIIYFDLFARSNKRSGAWMEVSRNRRKLGANKIQCPVVYLACNFAPQGNNGGAFLSMDEIVPLFHEFGHSLHHILSKIDVLEVSGVNGVVWDAVEVPSQLFENWCWVEDVLLESSRHYKTNKKLPKKMFDSLIKVKNFHSANYMRRQLEFALFDFKLHLEYKPNQKNAPQNILKKTREQTACIPSPHYDRFQNSFIHIFGSSDYAAGYYSYKWAEVMSSDIFAKFQEEGYLNRDLGQRLMTTIYEKGGSEPFINLFKSFVGRSPKINALLHNLEIE